MLATPLHPPVTHATEPRQWGVGPTLQTSGKSSERGCGWPAGPCLEWNPLLRVFYPVQGAARSTSLGLMSLGGATSRACGAAGLGLPGVQVMQKAP